MILGCTHYPLVAPMLQRTLGPRRRARHLRGRGGPQRRARADRPRAAATRARARAATASAAPATPSRSDALGTRFLQMPLGEVDARRARSRRWRREHRCRAQLRTRGRPSCVRRTIEPGFVRTATGSALISMGETRVICTASVQEGVPRWMAGSGPRLGHRRVRDASRLDRASASSATSRKGRPDGRTVEIQRLIGRSLRGVVDFAALGERTIYIDCDVLQADGGTRCASITGGMVALRLACERLVAEGKLERSPLTGGGRGGLLRDRRRRAAARPRLLRGLDRRGRRQRGHDRRRRPGRGAGHGRAHAALARAPGRAARARRRAGSSQLRALQDAAVAASRSELSRCAHAAEVAGAGHPQPAQAAGVRAAAGAGRDRRRAAARRASSCRPRTGETFAANALPKARAAAAAHGPCGDRRRLGDRGRGARRRARGALGPLRRPAGRPTRRTWPS